MSRKILISGPPGAGKSVIVRQVMSLYSRITTLPGGVGGLPLGYTCEQIVQIPVGEGHHDEKIVGRLEILGNYENTFRDHHGMHCTTRYRTDFLRALWYANKTSHTSLCEGGFTHPRRMIGDIVEKFCAQCVVLWLDPPEAYDSAISQRRRTLDVDGYTMRTSAAAVTVDRMTQLGAQCEEINDRVACLRRVCELIDQHLDWTKAAPPEPNYR